jgi:HK97 family phage major capsid protein
MSMQALRERLAALHNSMKNRLAEKGDQKWSAEDQAAHDADEEAFTRTQQQAANLQKVLDRDVEDNFKDAQRKDPKDPKNERQRGLDIWLRKTPGVLNAGLLPAMTAEELQIVRNTMSTTTPAEGGYTVEPKVASAFIDTLKDFGGMRRVAGQITTAQGQDMSWPSTDGTAEIGEQVAQNVAAATADIGFGTVPVNTYKFGSKTITIPIELLQDTTIDMVGLVMNRMRQRIGRIQNQRFSIGTGSGQPNGITVAASVGKTGTSGQTLTIIYDDLVDLIDSIDFAYLTEGEPLTFMTNQTLRKVVRKIKDTAGRPIWTPSYDKGIAGGFLDELLGYPLNINNDMPVPAANAKSMSFGQHKNYLIRDAMQVSMFRFDDSAFMSKGQVGYLAWSRAGGNLLDTASVKLYQHSAT